MIDGVESGLMYIELLFGWPVELLGEVDRAFSSWVDWKFRIYRRKIFCVPEINVVVLLWPPGLFQSNGPEHITLLGRCPNEPQQVTVLLRVSHASIRIRFNFLLTSWHITVSYRGKIRIIVLFQELRH
jgi:hypothetical protein